MVSAAWVPAPFPGRPYQGRQKRQLSYLFPLSAYCAQAGRADGGLLKAKRTLPDRVLIDCGCKTPALSFDRKWMQELIRFIYVRMPNKLSGCRDSQFLQAAVHAAAPPCSAAESCGYPTKRVHLCSLLNI